MISSPTTTTTVVRPSTTNTTTTTTTTVPTGEAAVMREATTTRTRTEMTTSVGRSNTNSSNITIRDTALHYQTTTKSTNKNYNQNTNNQDNQNTQNNQNELFINTFADCVLDPNCHLLYHHVGKTGGTTIEKIFYQLFPKIIKHSGSGGGGIRGKQFETIVLQCLDLISNVNNNNVNTIADDDNNSSSSSNINLNLNNTDDNISTKNTKHKNKSSSVLVPTKKQRQRQRQHQHRFLTFSTYREPIARTISDIHQLCNKNLNRRTKQLQEVCQRCTYDSSSAVANANSTATSATSVTVPGISMNDKVYWNKLIHNTNRIYRHLDYLNKHLLRHSHYRQISQNQNITTTTINTNTSNNSNNNNNYYIDSPSPIVIDYLMMDVIDIDDFLHHLDQSLVQKQQQQQQSQTPKQTPSSSSSSSNTKIIRIPYLNNENKNGHGHGHGHVIKSNQESIKFCNFGKQIRIIADTTQTSTSTSSSTVELEIVELLQTSIDIYNNFTTN
ncbi:hypothetical protein FRACYDRAFT_233641 [Fragilariopsis cylindrus CCMP1102]|uniref:Uncharacterized protein n=1 Tax=Fragilariopsis cylindrus CCMP1102 TaxID=635003 RepID=A0A1E7FZ84_9STRA|nr:hypothetical protein FRACYDRAFT_233641 [Fragilariopsis cylindrus CCMP1102]|eukprot:OEU23471.1 hypothetical protein FRACYDRAFT_233641 [Fragilariopsis cylindrus CCMP1102]